jgi:hypothetical protein
MKKLLTIGMAILLLVVLTLPAMAVKNRRNRSKDNLST